MIAALLSSLLPSSVVVPPSPCIEVAIAAEDPALLCALRDSGIALEICISSNVATGAIASLADHPVRRIHEAGVPIVLNTDDPAMFRTTLSREYALAETEFGFSRPELEALAASSFRYAFRPRS